MCTVLNQTQNLPAIVQKCFLTWKLLPFGLYNTLLFFFHKKCYGFAALFINIYILDLLFLKLFFITVLLYSSDLAKLEILL